jgi:6-phosphogluconolactonase
MKPLIRRVRNLLSIATLSGLGCLTGSAAEASRAAGKTLVYVGTYTGAKSKGIYVSTLDAATGQLTAPKLAAETVSPSFLAIHPNRRFVYAVNEVGEFNGKPGGAVSAFSLDAATGRLTLLNQQASGGGGPCHIVVDKAGNHALVANYGGGSVTVLPVKEDGRLGEATSFIQHAGSSINPNRQKEPHAHSINLDIANRFAFAADLGLDKVLIYRFDAGQGVLTPNDPPFAKVIPGAGPRHFALHPKGGFAYVINELHCTVAAFSYDPQRGELKEVQTISTLPQGQAVLPNFSTAEVQVHPSGKFLYGSNRGHDSVAVFTIDQKTGTLTHVENQSTRGKTPRNFGIDPTGKYLLAANQSSDNVAVFRIDDESGRLTPAGDVGNVGTPVCVKFVALP